MRPCALTLAFVANLVACAGPHDATNDPALIPPDSITIVIPVVGQSNAVGFGFTVYAPSPPVQNAQFWGFDDTLHSPVVDPVHAGETGAAYSFVPRLAQAIRAHGIANPLLLVPCARSATSSAQWADGSALSPPDATKLIGRAALRVEAAIAAIAGAPYRLGPTIVYQGESNVSLGAVSSWASDWTTILDALEGYWLAQGHLYWRAQRSIIVQLAPNAPTDFPGFGDPGWSNLRAAQASFVAGRASSDLVTPIWPFTTTHLDTASEANGHRRLAIDIASIMLAKGS